jgi:hypothetical protein
MSNLEKKKLWNILKYGRHLPNRLDIDLTSVDECDRVICSAESPNGIYSSLPEMIETEKGIPFEDWCYSMGIDPEINRYSNRIRYSYDE